MLIWDSATSLNITSNSFLVESVAFPTYKIHHLQAGIILFPPFHAFISFSCQIALARTVIIMLNRMGWEWIFLTFFYFK